MGGWRNWSQNLLNGLPLPAPRAFAALAMSGLASLCLIEGRSAMSERYPGYDVLAKRHSLSWNEQTRRVIGHRLALPREPRFLDADEEVRRRHGVRFHRLETAEQDALLRAAQQGALDDAAWNGMDCAIFFAKRLLPDIVTAYSAHPIAWNEIGFGGPASPRGYVRMDFDRRDPGEPVEARPGHEDEAARENARVG
jgi:hypothetical protein